MPKFRTILFHPFVIGMMAVIAIVSVRAAYSNSDQPKVSIPSTLLGKWHQDEGPDDVYMTADIYGGSIQINMESRDARAIYWLGTFDTGKKTTAPFTTVSLGDTDAMAMSLFGSGSKKKTFTYKNGVISYNFTMLGRSYVVELVKNKTPKPLPRSTVTPTYGIPNPSKTYSSPKATPKVVQPPKPAPKASVYKAPSPTKK